MKLFEIVARSFRAKGILCAVDRWTGAIRELSEAQYRKSIRDGSINGYVVRIGREQAELTARRIRSRPLN